MDKDILDHMEDLTIQASDRDPDAAASPAAPPAEANHTPRPDAAQGRVHAAQDGTKSAGSIGRKSSRKGRNRKDNKKVYLPWPLTLHTRPSSAAPVLSQTSVLGALPFADTGVSVRTNREILGSDEQEKTAILTLPWKEPDDALWPATSHTRAPFEASLAASGVVKGGERSSPVGRSINNKKVTANPWPLTVQVWANFTNPAPAQTTLSKASHSANSGENVEHKSKGPSGEKDQPAAPLSQQRAEAANSEENIEKKRRYSRASRKDFSVLPGPWPLTVRAWASVTSSDPGQTHLGGKSSATTMGVNVGQKCRPQFENSEEERGSSISGTPFSGAVLGKASLEGGPPQENWRRRPHSGDEEQEQSSAQQTPESIQGWRPAEKYPGDQDTERTETNFARQADCCHCGQLSSEEKMKKL